MSERNFFAELKRRNVYKVAVAYAVVSWLLIQAASILFPTFDAPAWAMKALVAAIVLCFPVALILSWAFEITPEGIKLESEIDPSTSVTRKTGRKIVAITVVLAVIAAALFVFQILRKPPSAPGPQSTAASGISNKSIAVLPFDNLSRDPDNAYFCEGVQDEILTRLAKVADLKVISRTSTQHFKSTPDNLPEIARQLGVAHIVEGSVQKSNDQVRVNVQLINAQNDAHLWAETFDRKLTDIFAVESEIAKTIAESLRAKLTGTEEASMTKTPTVNPDAYELYLKGRFFWNKRSGDDLRKSIEYLKEAIAKDPGYARAYAALADSYGLLRFYGRASRAESIVPAEAAAKKALELDDSLGEAHASLGLIATEELDFDRAIRELDRAIQLNPNYATAHHWLALALMTLKPDRAVKEAQRALELDPLSMIINADLSVVYLYAGRCQEAEAQVRKALEIDPHSFVAHYYLGEILQFTGRLKEAIPQYQKAVELNNDPYSISMLVQAYVHNGQPEEAQKAFALLNEVSKSEESPAYALAVAYTSLGDKNRALAELEQAWGGGNTSYLFLLPADPLLNDLHGDPRFQAIVRKIIGPKAEPNK